MNHNLIIHSDQHMHNWGSFAKTLPNGINSRLQIQLDELTRTYEVAHENNCNLIVYAGDLFHKRGEIKPTVFNPVVNTIAMLHNKYPNIKAVAIAGNHDLETSFSHETSNAPQSLNTIKNFHVFTKPTYLKNNKIFLVPWVENLSELMKILDTPIYTPEIRAESIVVIHAPLNGIIKGIPSTGLNHEELKSLGWGHIYAGHYHNYKCYDGVTSIGALTQQTWNDINTKAGFIHVHSGKHTHYESNAPKFINLNDPDIDDRHIAGNYVEYETDAITANDAKIRQELLDSGALGVVVNIIRKPTLVRNLTKGVSVSAGKIDIEDTITNYILEAVNGNKHSINVKAQEIYRKVKA